MKVPIGKGSIEVVQGDIAAQDTDAIVNAANNHLWMGSGVAGAIKKKGGQEIENEAVSKGPIEVGAAVMTGAGALPARHVIHAAGMGQDLQTDEHKVRSSTRASLDIAEKSRLASIAFPAIGTGVGGLDIHMCARIMLTEAIEVLMQAEYLKTIRFVLFDEKSHAAFETGLRNIFSAKK